MTDFSYPIFRKDKNCYVENQKYVIPDPYRWLENLDSDETKEFIDAQNKITQKFFDSNPDAIKKIKERLREILNYERKLPPEKVGKWYVIRKNNGGQIHSVLVKKKGLNGKEIPLLDLNSPENSERLQAAVEKVVLIEVVFSPNGKYCAYAISKFGSDWFVVYVRKVKNNEDLEHTTTMIHSSIAWMSDSKGFFVARYTQHDESEQGITEFKYHTLFFHQIKCSDKEDVEVIKFTDNPYWKFVSHSVSPDGKYLIFVITSPDKGGLNLYYVKLSKEKPIKSNFRTLYPCFCYWNAGYRYITNFSSYAVLLTDLNAQNCCIIKVNFESKQPECRNEWEILVAEDKTALLEDAMVVAKKSKMVLLYLQDVRSIVRIVDAKRGEFLKTLDLPMGVVTSISSNINSYKFFFKLESLTNPGEIYCYTVRKRARSFLSSRRSNNTASVSNSSSDNSSIQTKNGKLSDELTVIGSDRMTKVNHSDFKLEQVFYKSFDKTRIPLFILTKINTEGKRYCQLVGYGGFNLCLYPIFDPFALAFVDIFDGVYAQANIRGGGEYGVRWHADGARLNKKNSFKDFENAIKYLIDNNYTEKKKLAINGCSNGGLLVARCINRRPKLCQVAIIEFGVLDMLRFHLFSAAKQWIVEYGDPNNETDFEYLLSYSPLHNIRKPKNEDEEYPAILITTGDHDDRVSPSHSYKYAATIQENAMLSKYQKKPILLKIKKNFGHCMGFSLEKSIELAEEKMIFMLLNFMKE